MHIVRCLLFSAISFFFVHVADILAGWTASTVSSSPTCPDPVDSLGRPWYDTLFAEVGWTSVTLPNSWGGGNNDRYFRRQFYIQTIGPTDSVYFQSDDGLWLYSNGTFVGHWGGNCHADGCVNVGACNANYTVSPIPMSTIFHGGTNWIAGHVSESGGGEVFNLAFRIHRTTALVIRVPHDYATIQEAIEFAS